MNNSNRLMPAKSFRIFAEEMEEKDGNIIDKFLEIEELRPVLRLLPTIHLIQIVLLRKNLSETAAQEIRNRLPLN
jgi:hypothetical protein